MPSPLQYAANRLNAAKSTGPTSPKGKVRSSINALRHGLTARVVVLPTEDLQIYQTFSKEIVDSLHPETPLERQFAQTVADNQWRINRIRSIEDGMLAEGHFRRIGDFDAEHPGIHSAFTAARAFQAHSQDFVNLSIYEQRLHRSMKEALRQLEELQTKRRDHYKTQMDDAVRLHNTEKMKGLPYDPAPDGFVYAAAEIGLEHDRRHRLHLSKIAEQAGFDLTKYEKEAA
ncbi:MAG: hypothetical protein M3O35_21675 [Acidobacteriota bacterium]|nr:hypothetical protein [Acidobacteriota bacterium]